MFESKRCVRVLALTVKHNHLFLLSNFKSIITVQISFWNYLHLATLTDYNLKKELIQ